MKKLLSLLMLLCLTLTVAPAALAEEVVNVYNWEDYIAPEVLTLFTEETGIKVNYLTFDSNESMYTKLKTGGASYDVIIPSDYMVAKLIEEDMLEPLDFANIPNYAYIDEAFRTVPAGRTRTIIGVSGTVTTMTALAMGLKEYDHTVVDGHRLSLEDAYAVDDKFLRMTRAERREYKTIHPGRIDVVGGGAVVWSRVLARVSEAAKADHGEAIDSFVASEHGLLDGIVLDYGRRLLAQ